MPSRGRETTAAVIWTLSAKTGLRLLSPVAAHGVDLDGRTLGRVDPESVGPAKRRVPGVPRACGRHCLNFE